MRVDCIAVSDVRVGQFVKRRCVVMYDDDQLYVGPASPVFACRK